MRINREWSMPNRWTFKMKPVEALLERYVKDLGVGWVNPFCGHSLLGDKRNDLDPGNAFATSHQMASDFLASIDDESCFGVLFDPPYSPRQMSECYKSIGLKVNSQMTQSGWPKEKDHCARIIRPGGLFINFGWNSCGLGKKRGFEIIEILLIGHGGGHNDTIVTVERKNGPSSSNDQGTKTEGQNETL